MKWIRWLALWLLLYSPSAFAGSLHYAYLKIKDPSSTASVDFCTM